MKTIGLIGGMSWESSAEYYRMINQEMKRRLGGHDSHPCGSRSLVRDRLIFCRVAATRIA
jgi:aspartate/glutamate racemase